MINFLLCLSASSVCRWVMVRFVKFGARCCFLWIVCLSSFSKIVSLFSISIGRWVPTFQFNVYLWDVWVCIVVIVLN
jgi:hypothetical protein